MFSNYITPAKLFLSGLFVLAFNTLNAQRINPRPYSSQINLNYVRTWESKAAQSDISKIKMPSSVDSFLITTQYSDGLGRPIQTVVKQISPLKKDIVTPIDYDEFGRQQFQYLPFAANTTGGNNSTADGLFKLNPFQQDSVFSKAQYPGEKYFYSQTFFEASPLDRTLETFAPGENWVGTSWQANANNRRSVKTNILVNTVSDSVRIWSISSTTSAVPFTSLRYAAGELFKTVIKDEHSKQTIEYKDKEGRLILKKHQLAVTPGTAHVGWLSTYYVYDEHSNLRFVLSPKAIESLQTAGNWNISNTARDELCFYYGYNARNRMTVKKIPGAAEVFIIYDYRDRPVMTQDGILRKTGTWQVSLFDDLNRIVQTGLVQNSSIGNKSFTVHLSHAAVSQNYPFTEQSIPTTGYEELTKTFYDNYDWLTNNAGHPFLPNRSVQDDSYLFSASGFPFPQTVNQSNSVRGMVTGTKIKVLDSNPVQYLYSISYYDNDARCIQVQSQNILKGIDITTNQYSFAGQLLLNIISHQKELNGGRFRIITKSNPDHAGRQVKVEKMIVPAVIAPNTIFPSFRTAFQAEYNELGKLTKKKLGLNPYSHPNPLDSVIYDYNIMGWLLGANRNYVKSTTSTANYFGYELGYDKTAITTTSGSSLGGFAIAQFNGNTSGIVWKSTGDDEIRKYNYSYDAMNRLLSADFNQYTSGTFNKTAGLNFSVSNLTYDANGNILSQWQTGWKITGSVWIDRLAYTYDNNSNKLKNVIDASNDVNTQLSDFRSSALYMSSLGTKATSATDYAYDENGNLVTDRNKDIQSLNGTNGIEYNHLNLPEKVTIKSNSTTNKGSIEYVYDATGNKLKKVIKETGRPDKVTLNMHGIYQDDNLEFFPQDESRIRKITRNIITGWYPCDPVPGEPPCESTPQIEEIEEYVFDYFLTDHLGNVRMVLTEETKTDAYPAASMEIETAATEDSLYANLNNTRSDIPAGYPPNSTSNSGNKIARTNGNGNKIGPSIALKVMAGDKFNLRVSSWYKLNGFPVTAPNPITDLANALVNSFGNLSGSKANASQLSSVGILSPGATSFLNGQSYPNTRPKAYVNWILFDEQFKYVSSNSGYQQVGNDGEFKIHLLTGHSIHKNGYLYIYVSNETPNIDVFFDNLQVTHIRGPILEETHYYPFGLTIAGISSSAVGFGKENKRRFNDGSELAIREFSDGSGLELYETAFRSYDPQIGRFHQLDAMADSYENWSPYTFSLDNPVNLNDPTGLSPESSKNEDVPIDKGGLLENVTIKTSLKNKKNYLGWLSFIQKNRGSSSTDLYNQLKDEGVNEKGITLFWIAYRDLGYWDRVDEWEKGWKELVQTVLVETLTTAVGGPVLKVGGKLVALGYRQYKIFKSAQASKKVTEGGLNLYKFGSEQATKSVGWRNGDYFLNVTNQGSAKLNWSQNASLLRQEMKVGRPIYDTYSNADGTLKATTGFLNAERNLLINHGWSFNKSVGAWIKQ